MRRPAIGFDLSGISGARVVLIGFMGAGKTTLARSWSAAGGPLRWFDSDREALRELGSASAAEAFAEFGEAPFREAEREVVVRRAALPLLGTEVWSLGGGAVMDPDIQRALFGAVVIWLDAPIDALWTRAAGTDRPLARDREAFEELYALREPVYESLAAGRLDTGGEELPSLPAALRGALKAAQLSCRALVAPGAVDRIAELGALDTATCVLVGDAAVGDVVDRAQTTLGDAGIDVLDTCVMPMGEWHKQLGTAEGLLRRWSAAGVRRDTVVVAVGGGTLLDTAGFAASIYQRGLHWISVPTTVTAQVDAAIGGKTAVNMGVVKNVVGTVHFPDCVVTDPNVLGTLHRTTFVEGAVEALKSGLLAGEDVLALVEDAASHGLDLHYWAPVVAGCAAFKEAVVTEDPLDTDDVRAQLNFGHTLGHAVEAATGGAVAHGAAVALGMHAALRLSELRCSLDPEVTERALGLLESLGVATTTPLAFADLVPHLVHDKKRDSAGLGWVLLDAIGEPVTGVRLDLAMVSEVWDEHVHRESGPEVGAKIGSTRAGAHARVLVLFGINLGELGLRDPGHYGDDTLATLVADIERWASEFGLVVECRQTDSLERFVDALRPVRSGEFDAVIVNPGAWTHTERGLHDALESIGVAKVEVHLSDIAAREPWRTVSVIADVVDHTISGRGAAGYCEALEWIAERQTGDITL